MIRSPSVIGRRYTANVLRLLKREGDQSFCMQQLVSETNQLNTLFGHLAFQVFPTVAKRNEEHPIPCECDHRRTIPPLLSPVRQGWKEKDAAKSQK